MENVNLIDERWKNYYNQLKEIPATNIVNPVITKTMSITGYKDDVDLLVKGLPLSGVKTVLEIGCGYGGFAKEFLKRYPHIEQYVVVDHPQMLRFTKETFGDYDKIVYLSVGEEAKEIISNSNFDLLISNHCISETPGEYQDWIAGTVFDNVTKAFIIDGDLTQTKFNQWLYYELNKRFESVTIQDSNDRHFIKAYSANKVNQTLVLSSGRSGTNMVLEVLTAHPGYYPYPGVEDKTVISNPRELHYQYLAKSDTTYIDNLESIQTLLSLNPELRLVWPVRHPYDWAMSKLRRGQPKSQGGDGSEQIADDATVEGCISDFEHMLECFYIGDKHLVRMEDLILNTEHTIRELCEYLDIPFNPNMMSFPSRIRNADKRARYGDKLDTSQVDLYKRVDEVYDGYFRDKRDQLDQVWESKAVQQMIELFGYA